MGLLQESLLNLFGQNEIVAAVLLSLITIASSVPTELNFQHQHGHGTRSEGVCAALNVYGKSFANLQAHYNLVKCQFAKPEMSNTLPSAEILKRCRNGLKINAQCVVDHRQNFSGQHKKMFCSGLVALKNLFENVKLIVCGKEVSYINSLTHQVNLAKKKK